MLKTQKYILGFGMTTREFSHKLILIIPFLRKRKIEKRVGLPNSPFMELHYIKNNFFMDDNEILNNASKLEKYLDTLFREDMI